MMGMCLQLLQLRTSRNLLPRTRQSWTGRQRNCIVSVLLLARGDLSPQEGRGSNPALWRGFPQEGFHGVVYVTSDERVTLDFGRALQQARTTKSWTQKELATVSRASVESLTTTSFQRVNEKPQVVNDYECGRAIPNQQIISKLERAVQVRLRGKDMGKPLGPKKK